MDKQTKRLVIATVATVAILGFGYINRQAPPIDDGAAQVEDDAALQEASAIAATSQDADRYQEKFTTAIKELSTKDRCDFKTMRDKGGFSRVTGDSFYFIYCGEPMNSTRRWYYNPLNGNLSRIKAEM